MTPSLPYENPAASVIIITLISIIGLGIVILFIVWIVLLGEMYGTWSRVRSYWRQCVVSQRWQTTPNQPRESFHLPIQMPPPPTPPMDPTPTYPPPAFIRLSPRPPTNDPHIPEDMWL